MRAHARTLLTQVVPVRLLVTPEYRTDMRQLAIAIIALGLTVLSTGHASADVPPGEEHCVWTQPTGWHCVVLLEDPTP